MRNMKIIDLKQGSEEWLEFRRMGIGASDAPCILGVGFLSPYQLFINKMTGKETFKNSAMKRGTDLEPIARQKFIEETGIDIYAKTVINSELSWQFASLDGIDESHSTIVEIKCPGPKDHLTAIDGMIPGKYYPQLQHQLCVTGLKKGYYYSFDGKDGVIVEFTRDDKYIDKLLKEEIDFYERMIRFDPPLLFLNDYEVIDDKEWSEVCEAYTKAKEKESLANSEVEMLKERLISIAAERNVRGSGYKLSKILRKGTIDYANIQELRSIDLEKYRKKPVEYWKIESDPTYQYK